MGGGVLRVTKILFPEDLGVAQAGTSNIQVPSMNSQFKRRLRQDLIQNITGLASLMSN